MASTYIEITGTASRTASKARSAIDQLQSVKNSFEDLKATYDQMAAGGDWTTLGAQLGVTPADAEAVYNLWGSAVTELGATFITQLLGRTG